MALLRSLLREPVVHFFVVAGGLFAAYQTFAAPQKPVDTHITVSATAVAQLRGDLVTRLGRDPTADELSQSIDRVITREVLFREARALDLGRDDPVVRKRLIQKMEYVLEDVAGLTPPTPEQVLNYYQTHAERYRQPPRTALTHVFVASTRHPDPQAIADSLYQQLQRAPETDPATLGDPFTHGHQFGPRSQANLAGMFGEDLAAGVQQQAIGHWQQHRSPYGLHLVRVDARRPGDIPPLATVRAQVVGDWTREQRQLIHAQSLAQLRANYTTKVEDVAGPASAGERP